MTRRRCESAIRRIGATAYLLRDDDRLPFTASIQPRLSATGEDSSPLGVGGERLYTLFAAFESAGALLEAGDIVEQGGEHYVLLRAETQCLGGEPLYRWGVLRRASP